MNKKAYVLLKILGGPRGFGSGLRAYKVFFGGGELRVSKPSTLNFGVTGLRALGFRVSSCWAVLGCSRNLASFGFIENAAIRVLISPITFYLLSALIFEVVL